jgi:zinc D-Ala-D-Ala dipeptidase
MSTRANSRSLLPPRAAYTDTRRSTPPHSAGAAIDLTLADAHGHELDLGTRLNADPEESHGACYTHADNISAQAREHRDILGSALSAVGLVNYATEWCSQSSSCVQA